MNHTHEDEGDKMQKDILAHHPEAAAVWLDERKHMLERPETFVGSNQPREVRGFTFASAGPWGGGRGQARL